MTKMMRNTSQGPITGCLAWMVRIGIVQGQDGDSSLTPSWKGCVQKPAVSSPYIRGDDLSLDSCYFPRDY